MDERNEAIQPLAPDVLDVNVYHGIHATLIKARAKASNVINSATVEAYWGAGKQIQETVGNHTKYGEGALAVTWLSN
ncbi:MAG: hypothetical protein FWF19_03840 [Euryarchaeota archaeon]|nr:hypothetical protein [Euryarchaeota archaeon]